jgi:hypothetical protein
MAITKTVSCKPDTLHVRDLPLYISKYIVNVRFIYICNVFAYVKAEISNLWHTMFPAYSFCYGLIMALLWTENSSE